MSENIFAETNFTNSFLYNIQRGMVKGQQAFKLVALEKRPPEDELLIARPTGREMVLPEAPDTLYIYSSSGRDRRNNDGAWSIRLIGLDADFNEITEDIDLRGTSRVYTVNQYYRLNDYYVLEGNPNVGEIRIRHDDTDDDVGGLEDNLPTKQVGTYTVPIGKELYLCSFNVASSHRQMSSYLLKGSGGVMFDLAFLSTYRSSGHIALPYDRLVAGDDLVIKTTTDNNETRDTSVRVDGLLLDVTAKNKQKL